MATSVQAAEISGQVTFIGSYFQRRLNNKTMLLLMNST